MYKVQFLLALEDLTWLISQCPWCKGSIHVAVKDKGKCYMSNNQEYKVFNYTKREANGHVSQGDTQSLNEWRLIKAPLESDTTPCRQMLNDVQRWESFPGNMVQEAPSSLLLPVKSDTSFMKGARRKARTLRFPRAHRKHKVITPGCDKNPPKCWNVLFLISYQRGWSEKLVRKRRDFTRKVSGSSLRASSMFFDIYNIVSGKLQCFVYNNIIFDQSHRVPWQTHE